MKDINILSIDMDYIMEPSIEKYNHLVKASSSHINVWKGIYKKLKKSSFEYNKDKLTDIEKVLEKKINNINSVMFDSDHDKIIDFLKTIDILNENENLELSSKFNINIYNIDHHHDIYYNEKQAYDVDLHHRYSVGSWVWLLDKYSLIDNYIWISNDNSHDYTGMSTNCNFYKVSTFAYLENIDFDAIFICKSPHWIPPDKHQEVYEIITNIIKEKERGC